MRCFHFACVLWVGLGLGLVSLSGCGLELIAENLGHKPNERPASKLVGKSQLAKAVLTVTDAEGKVLEPFQKSLVDGEFELRLPSSKYSNLVLTGRLGDMELRALVPAVGEESAVPVDLNARSMTEALITEARLSADGSSWKKVTPDAYAATQVIIWRDFDRPGATQQLLAIVERLISEGGDPAGSGDPIFFGVPVLASDFTVKTSPLSSGWLERTRFDYDADGRGNADSSAFDALLAQVAQNYRPAGCPDPERIRIVFTVDFNDGAKNGNCGVSNRFKWAVDKPGKSMFFVGWLHKDSPVQDTLVTQLLGNGIPNQLPMHDDGAGGDEAAGDNIWTIFFDIPRGSRVGYKYTWGFRGAPWTGSEEWPGNSRIIEAVDVNGDDLVYRRDVFGDEATNKDRSNLNVKGSGSVDWTTDLRGYGIEAREQKVDLDNDCVPDKWVVPESIGPLTVSCQ